MSIYIPKTPARLISLMERAGATNDFDLAQMHAKRGWQVLQSEKGNRYEEAFEHFALGALLREEKLVRGDPIRRDFLRAGASYQKAGECAQKMGEHGIAIYLFDRSFDSFEGYEAGGLDRELDLKYGFLSVRLGTSYVESGEKQLAKDYFDLARTYLALSEETGEKQSNLRHALGRLGDKLQL